LIQEGHREILEADRDLGSVGLKPLTEKELQAIELFYQLKAEKQLRDSFSFSAKKDVYQFFEAIGESPDGPKKTDRDISKKERAQDFTKEEAEEYQFAILASFSEGELGDEQQEKLAAYLEKRRNANRNTQPLRSISEDFLLKIIKANPALLAEFESNFENEVANRKGYNQRQIRESVAMLSALFSDLKKDEKVLDLCTGTGVISTVVKNLGYRVSGIDLNKRSLDTGRVYDTIIQRKTGEKNKNHLWQADVLDSKLPDAEVWIAKHPCAPNMALPDSIIQRFAADQTAQRLYLLTCCADKSVHCCPPEYVRLGVTTEQQWDASCSSAVDLGLNVDPEAIEKAQEAFRSVNETRVTYVRDVLGFHVELVEIPGTVMNQMMIITKN
jgi:hypothetical protein